MSARNNPGNFYPRPGIKCLHRFRSKVLAMKSILGDRLMVLTERGVYISNKKLTRWKKLHT